MLNSVSVIIGVQPFFDDCCCCGEVFRWPDVFITCGDDVLSISPLLHQRQQLENQWLKRKNQITNHIKRRACVATRTLWIWNDWNEIVLSNRKTHFFHLVSSCTLISRDHIGVAVTAQGTCPEQKSHSNQEGAHHRPKPLHNHKPLNYKFIHRNNDDRVSMRLSTTCSASAVILCPLSLSPTLHLSFSLYCNRTAALFQL